MGHPPRIPVWLGLDQEVVYFITFCVQRRLPVLANDDTFSAFNAAIAQSGWRVFAAVLMPEHIHLLAGPASRNAAVGSLSAGIKRAMHRKLRAQWQWQPGCFDRLLRREESVEEKWQYIRENPVRAGLVQHWSDWPYRIGLDL
jgi:putative transposase